MKVTVVDDLQDKFILGRDAGEAFKPLLDKALSTPIVVEQKVAPLQVKVTRGHLQKYKEVDR